MIYLGILLQQITLIQNTKISGTVIMQMPNNKPTTLEKSFITFIIYENKCRRLKG